MFRELVKEVKECKKGRTTIYVSAKVLDRLLDLIFPILLIRPKRLEYNVRTI